jgi:hypothetical protein
MPMFKRTNLWMLAFAASLAFRSAASARPVDRPIIIIGGSPLIIEQRDGRLVQIDPRTLITHYPNNAVTSIEINSVGGHQVLRFEGQQCELQLTYGDIRIAVQTDPIGQNLRVTAVGDRTFMELLKKRRGRFQTGARASDAAIEHLRVLRNGAEQRFEQPSGHTEIVIHYVGEE